MQRGGDQQISVAEHIYRHRGGATMVARLLWMGQRRRTGDPRQCPVTIRLTETSDLLSLLHPAGMFRVAMAGKSAR